MTARQAGQQALAQDDTQSKIHFRVKVAPKTQPETKRDVTRLAVTANLYPLSEAFTATRYPSKNSDGSDLWPCLGNTSTPATDGPTVGDLSVTFPTGGGALGLSAHTWSLSARDGSTNGSKRDLVGREATEKCDEGPTEVPRRTTRQSSADLAE